ncbi:MAG: 6-phosphogluconolactonase [Pseudomonadales bacterium]|jgi:6-phosphogluconolactonase
MAIIEFSSADAQLAALIEVISESLTDAIQERGRGCFAVSGGNSPKALYQALSQLDLPWDKVDIVMVDDRFVPLDHAASNEAMIRATLLVNKASTATFWPLYQAGELEDVAADRALEWRDLNTPDCAIVGMGSDGHTASWFPDAQGLDEALSPTAAPVCAVTAKQSEVTGANLQRLTVSYAYLSNCPVRMLLMAGDEKRQVFEQACGVGAVNEMPIRALIRDAHSVTAYWTK